MVVDFQPSLHNSRLNTILQCSSSSARGSTASSPRCLTRRCTRPPAASLTCSSPKASRRASLSQSASARWSHWQAGTYLMHVQACCFFTATSGLVSDGLQGLLAIVSSGCSIYIYTFRRAKTNKSDVYDITWGSDWH